MSPQMMKTFFETLAVNAFDSWKDFFERFFYIKAQQSHMIGRESKRQQFLH